MIPGEFQYFSPTTVEEVVSLLQEHGDEAKLIAGGQSLLPAMKLRLAQPSVLIDLGKVSSLRGVTVNGNLTIGAMTTYHDVASSDDIRSACEALVECVAQIGDIQVRNRGTIGGSLAHADPAADLPALALALDATLTVQGPDGSRDINANDMFVDMLTTSLEPGEIITTIQLPRLGSGEGAAYEKMRHPASRYAIVGVAAYVKMDGGTIGEIRVAVTGAGPKAERQGDVESALVGTSGDDDAIAAASEKAGEDMEYMGDIQASEDYRKAMVKVYTKRAVKKAVERARG